MPYSVQRNALHDELNWPQYKIIFKGDSLKKLKAIAEKCRGFAKLRGDGGSGASDITS